MAGIAGGADEILIPEEPFDMDEVCQNLKIRSEQGKKFSIVVVAEGATPKNKELFLANTEEKDEFGHVRLGGIGHYLAQEIEKRMNVETRFTILGHIQRGGTPTAHDRILATRFGVKSVELIKDGEFGKMAALQGNKIVAVDLDVAVSHSKTVDKDLYNLSKIFFGGKKREVHQTNAYLS
jgi:6-phosphofructokinase 1